MKISETAQRRIMMVLTIIIVISAITNIIIGFQTHKTNKKQLSLAMIKAKNTGDIPKE